jgi:beta-glucosidase
MNMVSSKNTAKRWLGALLALSALATGCHRQPTATDAHVTNASAIHARATGARAFPPGFMWGVASAGFQSEGGDTTSNWAAWTKAGHGSQPIGIAVDGWHRYTEDADLSRGLGLNSFRLSLEWAKLEPRPGQIDAAVVQHYHEELAALRSRGLEPIVTVSHWAYPAWLDTPDAEGNSGWQSQRMVTELARHSAWVAREFGPQVRWWITLNEPNTMGPAAFIVGMHPPGLHNPLAYHRAMENQIAAHKACYQAIHANDPDAMVSWCPIAIHYPDHPGKNIRPYAVQDVDLHLDLNDEDLYDQVLPQAKDGKPGTGPRYADFVAINYFHSLRIRDYAKVPTSWDWPVYARGIYEVTTGLYKRYRLPLMITENGLATFRGQQRSDGWTRESFIVQHLGWLQRAIADGVPVLGYMHWSITDNYEWGSTDPRFGLYSIDPADPDLKRVRTPAADVYETITRENTVSDELLARFKPPTN